MEHSDYGVLEVSQLSDGVRNMIGLVADIAYRSVRLNSRFGQEAPKQTPGLVLIDEVDMHLHPEWQQIVLTSLTKAFPALQFIVTTHSPQVISTIKRENIRLLTENMAGETIAVIPEARTYGRSNADVMETVMDVPPEPVLPETERLQEYLAIVEQGDFRSDQVGNLRHQLALVLGEDHPLLVRADMVMRRREALER
jgi:predicted ATP-binding protein involved in virulence